MDLLVCDIPGVGGKHASKRNIFSKKFLLFRQGDNTPPLTCHSHVTYVGHVTHKASSKGKYSRARSYSYPMGRQFNPLPRLLEEDETINGDNLAQQPQLPRVHEFHWTHDKLSKQWLHRLNMNKAPVIATSPVTATKTDNNLANVAPTSNSSSNRKRVSFEDSHQNTTSSGFSRMKEQVVCEQSSNSETPLTENIHRRKPDSAYIALISGITHDASEPVSPGRSSICACAKSKTADQADRLAVPMLKRKERGGRSLKCILVNGLVQRKLFCVSPANLPRQRSNSLEYIQEVSGLGC